MGVITSLNMGVQDVDEAFLRAWIRAHVEDAAQLHKPVRPVLAIIACNAHACRSSVLCFGHRMQHGVGKHAGREAWQFGLWHGLSA